MGRWLLSLFFLTVLGCGGGPIQSVSGGTISGTTTFNVTADNAPASYTINGIENPTLVLQRGITYTFNLSISGHPFYIKTVQGSGTGNAYSSGVTGNGNDTGVITFIVPAGAPNTLYYNCSIHSLMTGTIEITN